MLHLLKGPVFKDTLLRIGEEKAQHLAGFKPTTSLLQGEHSNAVLQPLPSSLFTNGNSIPVLSVGRRMSCKL